MKVKKITAEKHREVQERASYRRKCHICGREWYDSLIGPCPERDGRQVCMYCCRLCEHHYREPGQIGQGCRVKDAARAGGRKSPHPALRDTFPQGKAGEGAAAFPQGQEGEVRR